MKAVIVDDETLARKRILELSKEIPEITEITECADGESAIARINKFKPDLVFLDINLQDMTGFEILQRISAQPKPAIIFVTAYDAHALKAFDFDAFDFLLKPFKEERFFRAVNKVLRISRKETTSRFEEKLEKLLEINNSHHSREPLKKLPIKLGNKTTLLDTSSIRYISASGCYAEIYTENNKYLIRESLNNLDETLSDDFFRIHRSTIVNINFIQEIVHSDYAEIDIRMVDKKLLSVSKAQKKEFLKRIGLK